MRLPRIRVELAKGKHGIPLAQLGKVAEETERFLISLSVDIGDPDSSWVADNFENGSLSFDVRKARESIIPATLWKRALNSVMGNDVGDDEMNFRIRRETRTRYFSIAKAIPQDEKIIFAVFSDTQENPVIHQLDNSSAAAAAMGHTARVTSYGEIQGVVHAFYKETRSPKLVVRELSTKNLVNCFFTMEMYPHAVALLQDRDAVVFVEGEVSEGADGYVTDIDVKDFREAPEFDEREFESLIGSFPAALTGGSDAASLIDEYRQ